MNIGFLDLETQYLFNEVGGRCQENCEKLKVSMAGLAINSEPVEIFKEDEIKDLLQVLDKLGLIVGYNLLEFDYFVLTHYHKKAYEKYSPKTLDIMFEIEKEIKRRISLDALAQVNLGIKKKLDGYEMPRLWRSGNYAAVIEHCRKDVEITRKLYRFGKSKNKLRYFDKDSGNIKGTEGRLVKILFFYFQITSSFPEP